MGTIPPAALWPLVLRRTEQALRVGALKPIPTAHELIEAGSVQFGLRIVDNLTRKEAERTDRDVLTVPGGADFDPFLPCDPDLLVGEVPPSHLAVLNKYNVVDHHLLIVTREFEEQEALLSERDFAAMAWCLSSYEGLAFYNAGEVAGASQRHKHLQMVPLPLVPGGPAIPIAPLLGPMPAAGTITRSPHVPFAHALTSMPAPLWPAVEVAAGLETSYLALLAELDLIEDVHAPPPRARQPYNLLVTREWMLGVPRRAERFGTISVNALGFAGAFLVRNAEERAQLRAAGPLAVLQQVA